MSNPYSATLDCGHIVAIPRHHHGKYGIGSRWMCRSCEGLRVIMDCEGDEHIASAITALRTTHEVEGTAEGDTFGTRFRWEDSSHDPAPPHTQN